MTVRAAMPWSLWPPSDRADPIAPACGQRTVMARCLSQPTCGSVADLESLLRLTLGAKHGDGLASLLEAESRGRDLGVLAIACKQRAADSAVSHCLCTGRGLVPALLLTNGPVLVLLAAGSLLQQVRNLILILEPSDPPELCKTAGATIAAFRVE